jgi:hydrogenase nickel incorporation protein HypB
MQESQSISCQINVFGKRKIMCVTCGCATKELRIEGDPGHGVAADGVLQRLKPVPALHAASIGQHFRTRKQASPGPGPVATAPSPALAPSVPDPAPIWQHTHAHGMPEGRMVQIELDILSKNNQFAAENRRFFAQQGIFTLNLLSSPGSGKTTLLVQTILALRARCAIAVIEGDQQTSNDAERIRATGAPAIQINTGKGCHLDAAMIATALTRLKPAAHSLLMIENVGNLVCPASFDLGEAHKVVVLSCTEGEDKPLKYPDMFRAASLLLLNKIDLLPYLQFDLAQCLANARRVNPEIQIIQLSATSGQGMPEWLDWLERHL